MKNFTFTSLTRLLGVVFLWMNLGHAPDLHAQTRKSEQDFTLDTENALPSCIWSDGTTMWVTNLDSINAKIYAYNLKTKAREAGKDFNTLDTENTRPFGLWSDNTTMWVTNLDSDNAKIYAYNLKTKAREAGKDFTLDTENTYPSGLWSHNTTMWVTNLDSDNAKIYAYNLKTKARNAIQDFNILATKTDFPSDIWSDDTTMWVADLAYRTIFAYNIKTKARVPGKDFNTLYAAGNVFPSGIWSDGTTMWVTNFDSDNAKIYAYDLPNKAQTIIFTLPSIGVVDDMLSLSATASSGLEVTYSSSDPSIAEVGTGMNANKLILKAGGNITITASQAGDDEYFATRRVTYLTVSKKDQTITFTSSSTGIVSTGIVGDTLDLLATASSGLEVSYASSDPSIAEVGMGMNEGKLILKAGGNATITISQAGNDQYDATRGIIYTITVSKKSQTITFNLSTGMLDDTLDLSDIATASSGLEVTYSSSNTTIAEVGTGMNEGKLILKALGNATITASQAGNDQYATVTDVTHTITVSKKSQMITFTLPGTGVVDDTLNLSATASSTLEVTYMSSNSDIAEVGTGMNEGKLILKAAGSITITASQAGDDQYFAAEVSHTITVSKKSQMITFTLPGTGVVDNTLDLSATASSTLEVTYMSSNSDIAEVGTGMNEGKLILKAGGSITITASQAGDDQYFAAEVSHTITVSKKDQTITFNLPGTGVVDDTLNLSATASSTLEVTYMSSNSDIAEVGTGMNEGKLILKAGGSITITASQAGDDQYFAAEVSHTITVSKKSQMITFTLPGTGVVDNTLDLSATASSTLEVTYVSSNSDIAEVGTGTEEGKLILKAGGNATITASQAGNDQYATATDVSHTITVNKKDQTITFNLPGTGVVDDTLNLSATASSTLEVTYVSSNSDIAEVGTGTEEGKLILKAAGDAMITASQAGNDRYLAATDVSHTITVSKKSQMITFTLSGTGVVDDTLNLSATASSTLEVTYVSSNSDIAEVGTGTEEGKLILKAAGNATITVSQAGNDRYLAATDVSHTITVSKKPQTITFTFSAGVLGDTLDLSATASSTLEVTYSSSNTTIAEVGTGTNTGKLILKAAGNATITVSQAGDDQYFEAPDVSHTITISKKSQMITFNLSDKGVVNDTLDLSATASSTLEVTYSSSNTTIAEVGTGTNTGKLILKAAGNATITVSQAGDDQYFEAPDVSHTITISKKSQMITFNLSDKGVVNDTLDLSATASSTLEVTYSSSNTTIAEVGTGVNEGKLILKAAGNATITASQVGNDQYFVATAVSHTITVSKKSQMITFTYTGVVGDTLNLSATASSTLEVTYSSSNTTIAEVGTGVNEGKLILKAAGNATITTIQAGDAQYLAVPKMTHTITVNKKDQAITFTLPSTGVVDNTLDLSATASSMLEVTYSSSDPSIAEVGTGINADKLILKAGGNATITANQAGDAQYATATRVTQRITVNEEVLSVDVKNTDIRVWPNPVANQLNISSGSRDKLTITLRNLTGQRLQERELEGEGQMDVSHLPSGVYLLHIRTAEETISSLIYKD